MKKTEKVNIAGQVFNLDEDAFVKLHSYLEILKHKFGTGSEAREIMDDIEGRIAELLLDKTQKKESVSIEDISEVMGIMGSPEDYEEADPGPEKRKEENRNYVAGPQRRLYRDPDHAVFGGVCGGLGAYFNADPIIFRILFVASLVAWGITGIIYIVLWVALPQAITASQRLEMRGEAVNVGNIERAIRDEYETVRQNLRQDSVWERIRGAIGEILNVILVVIKSILKVLGIIIGAIFILLGLGFLLGFLSMVIVQQPLINGIFDDAHFHLSDMVHMFLPGIDSSMLLVAIVLFVGLPLLGFIYWGFKLLFRFRAHDKWLTVAGVTVWIFAAFILIFTGISVGQRYQQNASIDKRVLIDSTKPQKLVLAMDAQAIIDLKHQDPIFFEKDQVGFYYLEGKQQYFGKPQLQIEKADGRQIEVWVSIESQGKGYKDASVHAGQINYSWELKDSLLMLSPLYSLPGGSEWKGAMVDIRVHLPVGAEISIPESVESILDYAESAEYVQRYSFGGKRWKMTEEGLVELN
jgi:phage shock protein PspC (stress-responsive transcriptional regulator)